jgi:hypothetical protein
MLLTIGTDDLHFDGACPGPIRDTDPSITGELKRVHGVCDHGSTKTEVVRSDRITDTIACIIESSADHTGVSDGLLNRVVAQIQPAQLTGQFQCYGSLPSPWKASEDN